MTSIKHAGPGRPALRDDHDLLREAVATAGTTALRYFRRDTPVYRKPDGSEVTDADLAVDAQLRDALCGPRPGYGWLSEESADDLARLEAERIWIVDPIDGTRAFIQDRDQWVIAAALVEAGAPVAAAIYNAARDELFTACRGDGAELNGAPIHVTGRNDLHGARILTPRGVARRAGWHEPGEPEVETSFVYSIAYRMGLVAAGRFDGLISTGEKSEWDVAAGTLIVQEAGGLATSVAGAPYEFNKREPVCSGTVAASPALHGILLKAVEQRGTTG
ncbi:MAG: inositol monophosphatase family protein [Dichotomicrobium sp.]